jgi:hypothetical protein
MRQANVKLAVEAIAFLKKALGFRAAPTALRAMVAELLQLPSQRAGVTSGLRCIKGTSNWPRGTGSVRREANE